MAEQPPIVSLSAARDRAIEELSARFASDDLSVEELDTRLELAYKARTMDDIQALTADLRALTTTRAANQLAAPGPGSPPVVTHEYERIVAFMSDSTRQGMWVVPQALKIDAIMSHSILDLSHAILPSGIIDIKVRVMMASMTIILPPGIRIASRLSNVMSSVHTDDELDSSPAVPGGPVIRLSGWACMSDVKTAVRRREEPGLG